MLETLKTVKQTHKMDILYSSQFYTTFYEALKVCRMNS